MHCLNNYRGDSMNYHGFFLLMFVNRSFYDCERVCGKSGLFFILQIQ